MSGRLKFRFETSLLLNLLRIQTSVSSAAITMFSWILGVTSDILRLKICTAHPCACAELSGNGRTNTSALRARVDGLCAGEM